MTNNQETTAIDVEMAFEEHLDEKLGSSTRRRFYNKNPYVLAAARTAFTAGVRSRDEELSEKDATIATMERDAERMRKEIEQLREDLKWALYTYDRRYLGDMEKRKEIIKRNGLEEV